MQHECLMCLFKSLSNLNWNAQSNFCLKPEALFKLRLLAFPTIPNNAGSAVASSRSIILGRGIHIFVFSRSVNTNIRMNKLPQNYRALLPL